MNPSGGGGMGGTSGTNGSGGVVIVQGGTGGGAPSAGCSADLRAVVDANGRVIETCGSGFACSSKGCVEVCQAFAELRGSIGCDFLAATPSVMSLYRPGCFAVFIANAWEEDVQVHVSRGEQEFDVTSIARVVGGGSDPTTWARLDGTSLAPDEVAVLFLSQDPEANSGTGTDTRCPVDPAVEAPGGAAVFVADTTSKLPSAEQTGKGLAFHIRTDGPVSAYGILPFGGASSVDPSATLLYPTHAWGTNYVAVVPPMIYDDGFASQWGQIVARDDQTHVQLVATSDLPGGDGVTAAPAGSLVSYSLDSGEFIQWQDSGEMSGSVILADGPVAFYGGASPLTRDSSMPECENGASDNAHQQIPPISALGAEYVAAPYRSRIAIPESVPYRIVGVVDGTRLTYDPPQPAAPGSLELGSVVDFEAVGPFSARSQDDAHPFYVAELMPGCGKGDPTGDEEMVNVLPVAQYQSKYVFFTDPTYGTSNLVLVRRKTGAGFHDVEIDCAGNVTNWVDVGTTGSYQMTDIDLVRDGSAVGACENGRHVARSEGPFGLVVWGLDQWASYAYPAGGRAAPIHDVVVDPVVR